MAAETTATATYMSGVRTESGGRNGTATPNPSATTNETSPNVRVRRISMSVSAPSGEVALAALPCVDRPTWLPATTGTGADAAGLATSVGGDTVSGSTCVKSSDDSVIAQADRTQRMRVTVSEEQPTT